MANRSSFCIISDLLSLLRNKERLIYVAEAAASVVETESSVVTVFPGSGTEGDTSKVVEAAASVVAVSMLTSGVSVVDADESKV